MTNKKSLSSVFPRPAPQLESRKLFFRQWGFSVLFTAGAALVFYLGFRALDFFTAPQQVGGVGESIGFLDIIFLTDVDSVGDALGGVSEVLIAILGLVITVVAIVVQLAAQRYTPKLIDLFIADWVNVAFFVLMVVTSMYSLLLVYSTTLNFLPFWGSLFLLGLTTLILSLLIPYFNYVFVFLTPGNIISIIRRNTRHAILQVLRIPRAKQHFHRHQREVALSMEQISDIALSAISQMDRNVAILSIRTVKEILVDYLLVKRRMPQAWFFTQKEHFPSLSSDFIQEIIMTRGWVEVKCFIDMELIFKTAINEMPDAVSAVANNTKVIGKYAIRLQERHVLADVVQFFNTFLRLAVNNRNPKALYNLLYQYRLLAEETLDFDPALAEKISFYFKYYGQIAQNFNIPLILITACFDIEYLLEKAYSRKVPNFENLIHTFLELDDNPETRKNEFELRSVRKAQLRLAGFLLGQGDSKWFKLIVKDMLQEPWPRLAAIRQELLGVTDRKFWEVTDRGVDFFYLDKRQKKHLEQIYTDYLEPGTKTAMEAGTQPATSPSPGNNEKDQSY